MLASLLSSAGFGMGSLPEFRKSVGQPKPDDILRLTVRADIMQPSDELAMGATGFFQRTDSRDRHHPCAERGEFSDPFAPQEIEEFAG